MATDPEKGPSKVDNIAGDAQCHEGMDTEADAELAHDAQAAADAEKSMSLWQGMKAYPRAVGWSVAISMATTMDGYDTGFLSSLLGLVSDCRCLTLLPSALLYSEFLKLNSSLASLQ